MCAATSEGDGRSDDEGPITDKDVAGVLRPFVRATRPMLGALSDADPFGLQSRAQLAQADPTTDAATRKQYQKLLDRLAETRFPGSAAWAQLDMHAKSTWWVRRVGRLTSLVAAVPGFGGALTSRLPITTALGAVAQGLVLCAIADEHGIHDEAEVVALLGAVLFCRDLSPTPRAALGEATDAQVDARAAELTGDLRPESDDAPITTRVVGAVWRMGRALLAVEGELGKRPRGGRIARFVSLLPVVGVAGKYLGEWSGLKQAAKTGEQWIHARHP